MGRFTLDTVADVTFYGANGQFGANSARLTQDPLFQGLAWLRYAVTDSLDLRGGLSYAAGGERWMGCRATTAPIPRNSRSARRGSPARRCSCWRPTAEDIAVRNGPMEGSRVNLRLLKVF